MISINFQNVFKVAAEHGLSEAEFQSAADKLPGFLAQVHERGQGFYKIVDDEATIEAIETYARSVEGKYDDIVVLGIGGSALGTITLRDSLTPLFQKTYPQLHVLENIDPDMIAEATGAFNLERTLFIPISKSGGTPETLAEYLHFRSLIEDAGLPVKDHFVFITDPNNGLLRQIANEQGIPVFDVPPAVGGRFSVLTPVGLLPAALLKFDLRALMTGARAMRDRFLSHEFTANLPFQLAAVQYGCFHRGKTQNVLMPYATKLRTFAAWFAQLLAESTGKVDRHGHHVGLTPIPALGVTDQHSQLQLFAQGPNDKLVLFIRSEHFAYDYMIPTPFAHEKIDFLQDKTFADLLDAEQRATADTLAEADRPNLTISIGKIAEHELGELFMLFEGATAFLGEFFQINAFDQPGVERSKVLTREYLA